MSSQIKFEKIPDIIYMIEFQWMRHNKNVWVNDVHACRTHLIFEQTLEGYRNLPNVRVINTWEFRPKNTNRENSI